MVDQLQTGSGATLELLAVSGQEGPLVFVALHKGVHGVPEGLDCGQGDRPLLIGNHVRFGHGARTPADGVLVGGAGILHLEGQRSDTVSVEPHMFGDLAVWSKGSGHHQMDISLAEDV